MEQPTAVSASAVRGVAAQAAKIYSLQDDTLVSVNAVQSDCPSPPTYSKHDRSSEPIPVNSASATAVPSQYSVTSLDLHDRHLSLAKPTQSSLAPGNVKRTYLEAGDEQQGNNMALVTALARDASPAASSVGLLGTIDSLVNSVVSEVATAIASNSASSAQPILTSSVSVAASASASPTPTTTNALSILFSALPSSIAAPLKSEFHSVISAIAPADQSSTNTADSSHTTPTHSPTNNSPHKSPTGRPKGTPTGRPKGRPTRRPNNRPTNHPTHRPTNRPTHHTTHPTTLHTSPSTITSGASHTSGTSKPTSTDAPIGSHPISNASVAGIASGLGAAAVLGVLAGVYLWRRKQANKPLFRRSGPPQAYPEVAWLYDPKMTPQGSPGHSRSGSVADGAEERLIPEPRPGSVEMPGSEMAGGLSPNLRPARPSSPLLAPYLPPPRDQSPGGSPSGRSGRRSYSKRCKLG